MALFEDAMAELADAMQAEAAVTLVYHRGADSTTLVGKCWVGRTAFRIVDEKGSRVEYSDRDFFIPCADLLINAVAVEPLEGDYITQVFANVEGNQDFELMAPDREPVWRYSDPQRTIYRLHTKRVVH